MKVDAEAEECWEKLADYVDHKYTNEEIVSSDVDYPYEILHKIKDSRLAFKELWLWFMLERKDPKTRKTPLEEYVAERVGNVRLARIMLGMRRIVGGKFIVIDFSGNLLTLEDMKGRLYKVEIRDPDPKQGKVYTQGSMLEARLYKWLDRYKFGSISLVTQFSSHTTAKR